MDNKSSRGSEWRKWDLHIHSPFTWLHNKYKHNNEGVIGCLLYTSPSPRDA